MLSIEFSFFDSLRKNYPYELYNFGKFFIAHQLFDL